MIFISIAIIICGIYCIIRVKSHLLKFAIGAAILGPVPGFLYEFFPATFHETQGRSIWILLEHFILLPAPYCTFVMPVVSPYCFAIGLLGGWIFTKCGRADMPQWLQPLAMVMGAILSALPWILLGFDKPAMISSAFWCIVLLPFRKIIFV